ncbi:MAG: hypothetical protein A3G87_02920 [Omnitrophica bacterium RIFCSPLOWO2_12_FULL_50_11]|nr:MAG: hypothetical protein A3G87_02920 [Omnitrophica bacterium RIFCSPLOWO2_12_FULL_50_11]
MKIKKRKGFRHSYTLDQIRAYSKLSARNKLLWLEEANRFCQKAIKGKTRKIWESFRNGTI